MDNASLTLLMVLFICFNEHGTRKNAIKYIAKAFISLVPAITVGAGWPGGADSLGSIEFLPDAFDAYRRDHAGNAMVAVGLCYNNFRATGH
ncbi:hypothetical protein ACNKHX_02665 [Shigella flexneri]